MQNQLNVSKAGGPSIGQGSPFAGKFLVFIDCEFTTNGAPKLLSIGLAASDGREMYAELDAKNMLAGASTFVLDTVVPQFGLMGSAEKTRADIGARLGAWLLSLGGASSHYLF